MSEAVLMPLPRPRTPWAIMSPTGTMHGIRGGPRGVRRGGFRITICGRTAEYGWDQRARRAEWTCWRCIRHETEGSGG